MVILGKDGKEYKSVKECLAADADFEKKIQEREDRVAAEKKAKEEELALRKAEVSKRKKELSTNIENAQLRVDEASKEYHIASEKAQEIMNAARKEALELLNSADAKLKEATQAKVTAIRDFNKEFGTYTTVLTGNAAWNEYQRIQSNMGRPFNILKSIFDWL